MKSMQSGPELGPVSLVPESRVPAENQSHGWFNAALFHKSRGIEESLGDLTGKERSARVVELTVLWGLEIIRNNGWLAKIEPVQLPDDKATHVTPLTPTLAADETGIYTYNKHPDSDSLMLQKQATSDELLSGLGGYEAPTEALDETDQLQLVEKEAASRFSALAGQWIVARSLPVVAAEWFPEQLAQ